MDHLGLVAGATVLDPWNGSGTTTRVAQSLGLAGIGIDINPALVVVARARLLHRDVQPSHLAILQTLLRLAGKLKNAELAESDLLLDWFSPKSARMIRAIERAIATALLGEAGTEMEPSGRRLGEFSPLAAAFYVALFNTVRALLRPFRSSNPTWLRSPGGYRERLRPSSEVIDVLFGSELVRIFEETLDGKVLGSASSRIQLGDSTRLEIGPASVDAVVTSPPYLTRIDYAVAMKPELAVLGFTSAEVKSLRVEMLGSPLSSGQVPEGGFGPDGSAAQVLELIRNHASHRSASYYYSTISRYLTGLDVSIGQIANCLKLDGPCVLVIQDSYYKEHLIQLQLIAEEMAAVHGLEVVDRWHFNVPRTKAAVHPHRAKYRQAASATESVLLFRKRGFGSCRST